MGFITVWLTAERLIFLRTLDPKEYDTQDSYDKALTDHLTTLYIIYSNAPYVGLLGTVLGIMITFYDMGTTGNINAGDLVRGRLAENDQLAWTLVDNEQTALDGVRAGTYFPFSALDTVLRESFSASAMS